MKPNFYQSWKKIVPQLDAVLRRMNEKTIIAVGVAPFSRIIPSLFLKNYLIYCVKDTSDLDVLRPYAKIFCLEEKFPKVAPKVHSTNYLLGNYAFEAFLKSIKRPFKLMFYQTTPPIVKKLEEKKYEWIGNQPEIFSDIMLKGSFRNILKELNLPHMEDWKLKKEEFLPKSYEEIHQKWNGPFVIQRADFDVSGEQGTFFIKNRSDWQPMHDILSNDARYNEVQICPFIVGPSVSILGCVTPLGILTSTLQLQLIDVPESLHDQLATGVFLGHDWGARFWDYETEKEAQKIVEKIGEFLGKRGYKGIFGIDFVFDEKNKKLYPIECNPRFTGALPIYSLITAERNKVPPIEFFHLISHLEINADFDFQTVNMEFKNRFPLSHISLVPKGVYEMKIPLRSGVYYFNPLNKNIVFRRPGAFLWDLKNNSEFIIIDSVPRLGGKIIQNVPRLFKIIFPRSIAQSSFSVDPEIGQIIRGLSVILRKNQILTEENNSQSDKN